LVVRRANSTASRRSSGKPTATSCSELSSTRRAPSACSSCISRLRCVLLGFSSSCTFPGSGDRLIYHSVFPGRSSMAQARFSHDMAALKTIAADALAHAAQKGASACDAEASDGYGQTVTVRKGEVETIEYNRDKSVVNSEGASVSCQQWQFALANSHGFLDGFPTSRHTISCAVIAAEDGRMQRDDWYVSQRSPRDLAEPEAVGDYAGRRALARL